MRPALIALLALAAGAVSARAQEDHTFRRTFTFLRDNIVIDVVADGSGSLRIVRGGRGDVTVAALARGALLSTAAPDRPEDPLRLIALGPGSADWIVTVPAHVRVQVRAPDSGHVVPANGDAPIWRWRAPRRPVHRTTWHEREREHDTEPAFAFAEPEAPDTIAIDGLAGVRRIAVRYEGESFGIAASDAASVERAATGRLDVQPRAGRPIDLLIVLPAGTTATRILADGLLIVTGAGETGCTPVTISTLPDGTRVLDFTPLDGRLECAS